MGVLHHSQPLKPSVLPEVIASPVNLQMLTENANVVKHSTSHMTLEQLYNLYEQFNNEVIYDN